MVTATKVSTMSTKKKIIISLMIVIGIVGMIAFDTFFTGYRELLYATMKCQQRPVAIATTKYWRISTTYLLPGDYKVGRAQQGYACTEQEAIDKGYTKSQYKQR